MNEDECEQAIVILIMMTTTIVMLRMMITIDDMSYILKVD